MSDYEDDLDVGSEPPVIDPYETLGITSSATADEIKKSYRKAALKHHPDKAPRDRKDDAHQAFQNVAFAYAVLSDPARRKRYDDTGSTSESIVDSEGFNWSDYYREQYKNAVSADAIEQFSKQYKGSDEEKNDVIAAYENFRGNMDALYETIMLSNVLEDDERFCKIIDDAIRSGAVISYADCPRESYKEREIRLRRARKQANKEARDAERYAKEIGVHDKLFGDNKGKGKGKGKGKDNSEDGLAALILKRQQDRSGDNFLDRIAEKYGATGGTGKKGKKRATPDEPPEEMFAATGARYKANTADEGNSRLKRSKKAKH